MRRAARAAAFAAALLVPLLAGCLQGPAPEPLPVARLACLGEVCNFRATVEPADRQGNEVTIAVNPLDPLNIIASAKDYTPGEAGQCVWAGIYTTHDGGATWKNANVPGSPWRRLNGQGEGAPNDFSRFWCATDPVVAFGPDGTAYWTVMPYQCDPVSGSRTGAGVLPDGGFNDWFWTCSSMYVLVSEDGGDTWPLWREVAFGPRLEHDKQWMAVAPGGQVLLCWDRDPSYQAGSLPGGNAATQVTPQGVVTCSWSTDKGRSWSDPTDVNPGWHGFLPWVDFDRLGTAWMATANSTHILVTRSTGLAMEADYSQWAAPTAIGTYTNPPPGGPYGWPVLNGSAFRTFAVPSLAVDRTGLGPARIHVAWMDHAAGYGQVMLASSLDNGQTWSTPRRVRDDSPNPTHDQFMPALSVGPDGTLDLLWYDRRDDPANHLFTPYYAYSVDQGRSWSRDLRVGEELSDEQYSHHQNGMVFLGDYLDIDSSRGRAHLVWVDTRDQKADVYVATVERPSAGA